MTRPDGTVRLSAVPADPAPFVPREDFPDLARERWTATKVAYDDAVRATAALHSLLHRPGQVRVLGTVTGALHTAKQLRDAADRMVVDLQAIVDTARRLTPEDGGR